MPGLHLNNVTHAFGDHRVVAGVSVFVAPGELLCLLGPSGGGKTTLLRIAAGLERLQTGRVTIGERVVAEGNSVQHLPPEKRGVGLMFQDFALFPHLTVFENIAFGVDRADSVRRKWIDTALDRIGLSGYRDAYPHILSGGQQQRVALLRALAPQPQVMLLDEPFSGLDVTRRAETREQTLRLLKETSVATLMVTHDPEEAMFMADRILVMAEGRIVQDGTPTEVYFEPADAYVMRLFGPVNAFDATVRGGHVDTPLGTFAAPDFNEGQAAEVLVRPEAFAISGVSARSACEAAANKPTRHLFDLTVTAARSLGRSTHLELRPLSSSSDDSVVDVLSARVPGVYMPDIGTKVSAMIDPRHVHVFPRSTGPSPHET